jgi:uncharacterized Zn-finger protein
VANTGIPYFQNDAGVAVVHVGSRRFMCMGAKPPFDHPHIFIEMGDETDAICPYCSTRYRYKSSLAAGASEPAECVYPAHAA